jgi:hypothetical protein
MPAASRRDRPIPSAATERFVWSSAASPTAIGDAHCPTMVTATPFALNGFPGTPS